jgi:hypothetical protein
MLAESLLPLIELSLTDESVVEVVDEDVVSSAKAKEATLRAPTRLKAKNDTFFFIGIFLLIMRRAESKSEATADRGPQFVRLRTTACAASGR